MQDYLMILGMLLVTFIPRYILFAVADSFTFPPLIEKALRYVPIAVLSAIIAPIALLDTQGSFNISWDNAYLVGTIIAIVTAWLSKHMMITVLVGFAGYMGWKLLLLLL